jgi:membrane protease YdiL (CAAX protease family)
LKGYYDLNNQIKKITAGVVIAAAAWYVIFVVKPMNFWLSMSLGVFLLVVTAISADRAVFKIGIPVLKHLTIGIVSAAVLYAVFYLGNYLSSLIIPMKDEQIASVYMNKDGTNLYLIGAALLFVIGPGEELFWRGFIQRSLSEKYGAKSIIIAACLYAAVHIATWNFMLTMAALICGLFWGALYYKVKNLYPVIISHALWDLTVFIVLPFHK